MQPTCALQAVATMVLIVLSRTQAAPITGSYELDPTRRASSNHTPHALKTVEVRSDEGTPVKYWKRGEDFGVHEWKREETISVQEWRRQANDIPVQEWKRLSPGDQE
ncbi:hypothetical protein D9619_007665 [Psilocybe cf. subviscida]|uniref:Secreted protein n=1 Tax=Psilocybe cf. subviscida TaxID=2480587 RepID=A0A8H5ATS9_9AGAR|nr:hypothetical protein D9619_007665 [Psilocybe cf. subviscida]